MKKISIAIICLFFTFVGLSQKPGVFNGILAFNSSAAYASAVEKDDAQKQVFYQELASLDFKKLKSKMPNTSIPDSMFDRLEFIINILNEDGVVKIGQYLYKIDYAKGKVFTMHEVDFASNYSNLVSGATNSKVGAYDFDFDVIDMVEAGILTQPTEAEMESSSRIQICWKGSRARNDNRENALYFRDLSDPLATFGSCINYFDGRAVANTRLRCKVEYLSLGIWHRLDIDAKIQKQSGKLAINGIPLWVTAKEKTGEQNWDGFYTVKYRGRCASDNEQNEVDARISHPISNENKGRRVFWERTRGLRYYCLIFKRSEVFTNNMFVGPAGNASFCAPANLIINASPARRISTIEFPALNPVLKIKSQTDCQ